MHRNRQNENPRISRIGKTWETQPNRFTPQAQGCWTQDEIAESEGISKGEISEIWSEFPTLEKLTKSHQTLATYSEPEWTPPIYNPTPFLPEFYLSLARG